MYNNKKKLLLSLLLGCHDPNWTQEYSDSNFSSCSSSSTRWVGTLISLSFLPVHLGRVCTKKKGGGGVCVRVLLRAGRLDHCLRHPYYLSEFLEIPPYSATLHPLGSYSASVH